MRTKTFLFFLSSSLYVSAETQLISPTADAAPTSESPAPLALRVVSSRTLSLTDRELTLRRVAPPALEIQPESVPEKVAGEQQEEATPDFTASELLFISATVHQNRLSHVRGQSLGGEEFSAWTDIDFNNFCGTPGFVHQGTEYSLMMGIGNDDSMPPEAVFPAKYGSFHFEKGETPETTRIAEAFSAIYAAEWEALAAARLAREATAKVAAAKPPRPPADITISIWDKPSRPLTAGEKIARDERKEATK